LQAVDIERRKTFFRGDSVISPGCRIKTRIKTTIRPTVSRLANSEVVLEPMLSGRQEGENLLPRRANRAWALAALRRRRDAEQAILNAFTETM